MFLDYLYDLQEGIKERTKKPHSIVDNLLPRQYKEGNYLAGFELEYSLSLLLKLIGEIQKGTTGIRQGIIPLAEEDIPLLLGGISSRFGFIHFIPFRSGNLFDPPEIEPIAKHLLHRLCIYAPDLAPLTQQEWQDLREMAKMRIRIDVGLSQPCVYDTLHDYVKYKNSEIKAMVIRSWPKRYHYNKPLQSKEAERELAEIVNGEEARLREFVRVLQGTQRAVAGLVNEMRVQDIQTGLDIMSFLEAIAELQKQQEKTMQSKTYEANTDETDIHEPEPVYEDDIIDADTVEVEEETPAPATKTFNATHTVLGKNVKRGGFIEVNDTDRYAGMHIVGSQGMGKTGLLLHLIYQDLLKENAVIVIDPHGDLLRDVIALLPKNRVEKTYYLDLTDYEHPYGINLFYTPNPFDVKERNSVHGRVVDAFKKLWPDIERTQYFNNMIPSIVELFLDNPGYTMGDIDDLFTIPAFRGRLLDNITDKYYRDRWESYKRRAGKQGDESDLLLSRLSKFLNQQFVRNIIMQERYTIPQKLDRQIRENGAVSRNVRRRKKMSVQRKR